MKIRLIIFLLSLLTTVVLCNCTPGTNNTVIPTTTMTAVVGRHTFTENGDAVKSVESSGVLTITGKDSIDNRTITLVIHNYDMHTGVYTIDNDMIVALYDSSASYSSPAVRGAIYITSVSPDIVGTFSFTCADSTYVSSGVLAVPMP